MDTKRMSPKEIIEAVVANECCPLHLSNLANKAYQAELNMKRFEGGIRKMIIRKIMRGIERYHSDDNAAGVSACEMDQAMLYGG